MFRLVYQSYANNEVRIGWDDLPYPRKSGGDLTAQKELHRQARQLDTQRNQYLRDNKLMEYRDKDGTLYQGNAREGYARPLHDRGLVISSEVQESDSKLLSQSREDPTRPVKPTRFGRNARHRLLEAGALCEIERSNGHEGCFVTFTLPGSTQWAYAQLSKWSGIIVNRILQVLRDYQWQETYFYVWELQKRGALHLHLFVQVPQGEDPFRLEHPLKAAWYSALGAIPSDDSHCMFRHRDGNYCTASGYWRYDYQLVAKGVANYLSKYVSKEAGSNLDEHLASGVRAYYPRRWWGMSRSLTQRVTASRKVVIVDGLTKKDCMDALDSMMALLHGCNPVMTYEYTANIGRKPRCPSGFGVSYRTIAYFDPGELQLIEVALRTHMLCVSERLQRKGRITTKGFARSYGGEALDIVQASCYSS